MDKWFVNMIAGAVLSALLVIFGTNTFINIVYPTGGEPEAPPAQTQTAETDEAPEATSEEAEPELTFASLLVQASADAGERESRKCAACHSFDEGGANKIGPKLHGVVGREVANVEGFAYSTALQEYGGTWDYERLSCYLENPSECVPGNKMSFAGIKNDEARANVIAYLRDITPDAPPLPEEQSAEADAGSDETGESQAAEAAANEGEADAEAETASDETTEDEASGGTADAEAEDTPSDAAASTETEETGDNAAASTTDGTVQN